MGGPGNAKLKDGGGTGGGGTLLYIFLNNAFSTLIVYLFFC